MAPLEDAQAEMDRLRAAELAQHQTAARLGVNYSPMTNSFSVPTEQDGARLFALVHDLDGYQKRFWWLRPVFQYAMAKTGIAPDSPTAKAAAEIGARVEADQGFGFQQPGTSVKAALAAVGTATSGQGVAYAGSYDWGFRTRDLNSPDQSTTYDTHYTPKGSTVTKSVGGIDYEFDPNTGAVLPANARTDPQAARIRDQARQVLERYKDTNPADLDPAERDRYSYAQRTLNQSDQEIKQEQATFATPVVPYIRTGFMALDAPLQEVQGQVRNVYGLAHGNTGLSDFASTQSDLGVAISQDGLDPRNWQTGNGLLVDPASPVHQELLKRQRERGTIGGHAVTLGRWAADQVADPDTLAFNVLSGSVDAAVAIKGDPSFIALSKYSKLKAADELFTESGGLLGLRKTVTPAAVNKFWDSDQLGEKVVDWVMDHPKTYDIIEGFNRKLPANAAYDVGQLAGSGDRQGVKEYLRGLSGGVLREKPNPFGVTTPGYRDPNALLNVAGQSTPEDARLAVKRTAQQSRMNNIVPLRKWDLEDGNDAVMQTERFLRNAKAPNDMVYDFVDRMAGAKDRFDRYNVLDDLMGSTNGLLVKKYGIDPSLANRLVKLKGSYDRRFSHFFVDELGEDVNALQPTTTKIGGTVVQTPSPHLLNENIGQFVDMPDTREIRRMTSKFRPLIATKEAQSRLPIAVLNGFQDAIWKPAQLLRGAWTLRVIGEEQVRMAAAGLDSMFHHPISYIAMLTGHKNPATLTEEAFQDVEEWQKALTHGGQRFGFGGDPHAVRAKDWVIIPKTDEHMPRFIEGWAGELQQLHNDTIARTVARSATLDDAVEQVANGAGRESLVTLSKAAERPDLLTDPKALRDYVESVERRIAIKTGGHEDLRQIVRTGKLNGKSLSMLDQGTAELDNKVAAQLKNYLDVAPEAVKGQRILWEKGESIKDRLDHVVESMFGVLMSRPTNYLSRSPAFKQFYYQRVPELMPLATLDAQQAAIHAAEASGVDKSILKAMKDARGTTGELTLEQMDHLAKGHALDTTKHLLYDVSERSQFFDTFKLIFPFGEAWKEVLTRWATLMSERPQNLRRLQQIIQAARGEGLAETVSQVTGEQQPMTIDPNTGQPVKAGFFHKDSQGQEVFNFPFSEQLNSAIAGVPVPLAGRVSGLNMVGNVWPALGPMAAIPAAYFIPDKPQYDWIRDTLFPYGPPGDPTDPTTWAQEWMPSWVKRVFQPASSSPDDTRLYANSMMEVARYLASTGDYDLSTPEGQSKLMEDAKSKANALNWVRGVSSAFAPTAPSPEWIVKDKNGSLVATAQLATEYRSLQQQEHDGQIESASQEFLNRYGTDPFLVMQSKTQAVSFGYPTDSVGLDWMREHPDLEKKYPNVFGYFAPSSDDPNDFSYNAYLRAIDSGAKKPLTLEQFVKLGMARLASTQYAEAEKKVAAVSPGGKVSAANRAWLRDIRQSLIAEYPGYAESLDGGLGLTERADKDQQIRELQSALKDPTVADTDAGQALALYFEARDKVSASYVSSRTTGAPDGWRTASSAVGLRDWLRDIGSTLVAEHPTFEPLWSQLLEREMSDDLDAQQAAA